MPSLAATVGLSPQHLRALARHQVGMPLGLTLAAVLPVLRDHSRRAT